MAYARRVDANQPEIVAALRRAGGTVTHIHTVGQGCPDLLVGFRGCNYLLECKVIGGKLTEAEKDWHETWEGQRAIVHSAEEALAAIGAI